MFLTVFYGFFCICELAARSACHTTVISYDNIRFIASGGKIHSIKITITHFKHNTSNRPFDLVIPVDESSPFCPVKFILRYCNLRGNKPGPLFCHADNTPITVNQFNTELRRCLNFCGLNAQRYKSHSFRIGAACLAADKGFSDAQIRVVADGSLMPLNFTFVILHYKEFNFAWVRHGLPCILPVICRTFRSTQGLFYLIGSHARAAP